MNSEERQMIADLFERMRNYGPVEKEGEADRMIREEVRRMPDAPYMLVQSVLVQEMALQRAEERIRELEDRVADAEASGSRPGRAAASFLGGLFGGGSRSTGDWRERSRADGIGPFGDVPPMGAPERGREDRRAGDAQQMRRGGGGGFLQSAVATAAGVAGGVLLADSIRGLMGGEKAGHRGGERIDQGGVDPGGDAPAAGAGTGAALPGSRRQRSRVEDAGYDGGDWGRRRRQLRRLNGSWREAGRTSKASPRRTALPAFPAVFSAWRSRARSP